MLRFPVIAFQATISSDIECLAARSCILPIDTTSLLPLAPAYCDVGLLIIRHRQGVYSRQETTYP
eukprot:scaffold3708_cov222-Skeletonema_menzelii.AAC.1